MRPGGDSACAVARRRPPLSAFSFGTRRARSCSGGLETCLRSLHQPFRIGDGATVLTLANLAARIEGFDPELEEFAFHAEERGFRGNLGVVGRGRQMLDVDCYSDRSWPGWSSGLMARAPAVSIRAIMRAVEKTCGKTSCSAMQNALAISSSSATYAASPMVPISIMNYLRTFCSNRYLRPVVSGSLPFESLGSVKGYRIPTDNERPPT